MSKTLNWQRRAARLGWVAVGLAVLSVALLALAAWALATERPRMVSMSAPLQLTLPVDVTLRAPRPLTVLGIGLALSAYFGALSAIQAAIAMRVLARDRRIPDPLTSQAVRSRRLVLGSGLI